MSRQELAEAVNAWQWQHEGVRDYLDENDIGSYERGDYRWPREPRRNGLRAVLGVQTDVELGFYRNRRSRSAPTAGETSEQARSMPEGAVSRIQDHVGGAVANASAPGTRDISPHPGSGHNGSGRESPTPYGMPTSRWSMCSGYRWKRPKPLTVASG
ncbi:hypothetical protein GCM10012284_59740 [Mangrovihabitans endophyticus]|uniref:Uncharacterized protein n=1 Tax=Mangrovihabitans endophyticus TaxID=1751298 RepID=A0A8J3C7J3_9ACTN|nr:hypothetical protein GCM10012284_59740 [Mangrovihabitans endophyticus]